MWSWVFDLFYNIFTFFTSTHNDQLDDLVKSISDLVVECENLRIEVKEVLVDIPLQETFENFFDQVTRVSTFTLVTESEWRDLVLSSKTEIKKDFSSIFAGFTSDVLQSNIELSQIFEKSVASLVNDVSAVIYSDHIGDLNNILRLMRSMRYFETSTICTDLDNLLSEIPNKPLEVNNFFETVGVQSVFYSNRSADESNNIVREVNLVKKLLQKKINFKY